MIDEQTDDVGRAAFSMEIDEQMDRSLLMEMLE